MKPLQILEILSATDVSTTLRAGRVAPEGGATWDVIIQVLMLRRTGHEIRDVGRCPIAGDDSRNEPRTGNRITYQVGECI
jgi:hypothetical protein